MRVRDGRKKGDIRVSKVGEKVHQHESLT